MDTNAQKPELAQYALDLVYYKARQLVGKAGYTEDDVEDIEQDLILHLLERLPRFDPAKGRYNTFVARVTEAKISNLLRDRQAARRDYRREAGSLNDEIPDGAEGQEQQVATMTEDEHDLRTGKYTRPGTDRTDFELDLAQVLSELPDDLRAVAEMLMTLSPAQVARKLGIPRSTFYDNQFARLRAVFAAKGLGDYLP